MLAQLAKRQIAAKDRQPQGTEHARQGHEKRRIAVRSRAVRQDKAIPTRIGRVVQKPSNRHFIRRSIQKFPAI